MNGGEHVMDDAGRRDWSGALLFALLVVAEAAVLALVTAAAFSRDRALAGGVSPPPLVALLLLGAGVQRLLATGRLPDPWRAIIAVLTLLLAQVGALWVLAFPQYAPWDLGWGREAARGFLLRPSAAARPVWGVTLLVAYAWVRGRTREEVGIEAAAHLLRWGTAAALVALAAATRFLPVDVLGTADGLLPPALYAAAVLFLGCALAAIALARLRAEQSPGLAPHQVATCLVPVGALLLLGVLLSGPSTQYLLQLLTWALAPLLAILWLLQLLLVAVSEGVAASADAFVAWFEANRLMEGGLQATPPPGAPTAHPTPQPSPSPLPTLGGVDVADPTRALLAAALLGAIIWLVARRRHRHRPPALAPDGERHESVFRWGLLGEGLAELLRRGRPRRRPDPLAGLRGDPRWRHTRAIRILYRRLLRRGRAVDLPRARAQTPDEYAPALARRLAPGERATTAEAVAALTARYDDARYRDEPATAEDAAAARAAWEALEKG